MMYFSSSITQPFIRQMGYHSVLEIGASLGKHSQSLLQLPNLELTVIDPCMDCDLKAKFAHHKNITLINDRSLNALASCHGPFDCIFIDGDHNWYTVYHELKLIEQRQLLAPGGTIFLHDVAWPYGRRDMYYDTATLPDEYLLPHAKKGIVRYQSSLVERGGANADLDNAQQEGGPRNGVLTAIENYLSGSDKDFEWLIDKRQFGLGVLIDRKHNQQAVVDALRRKLMGLNLIGHATHQLKRLAERFGLLEWLKAIASRKHSWSA